MWMPISPPFSLDCGSMKSGCKVEELPTAERRSLFQLFLHRASLYKEEVEFYLASGQQPNEFAIDEQLPGPAARRIHLQKRLSQSQYQEITSRFFIDSGDLNIFRPIGQALQIANAIVADFKKDDIDLVLYTGGASRMGAVKAALESYFAPKPCFSITDEEACNTVALGAASCRYDAATRTSEVRMTYRLLESILTRDDATGTYITVVPLTAKPRSEYEVVDHSFGVPRATVNLHLPLFRGAGPLDHNLMAMQDLVLPLPHVIQEGSHYSLSYRSHREQDLYNYEQNFTGERRSFLRERRTGNRSRYEGYQRGSLRWQALTDYYIASSSTSRQDA